MEVALPGQIRPGTPAYAPALELTAGNPEHNQQSGKADERTPNIAAARYPPLFARLFPPPWCCPFGFVSVGHISVSQLQEPLRAMNGVVEVALEDCRPVPERKTEDQQTDHALR